MAAAGDPSRHPHELPLAPQGEQQQWGNQEQRHLAGDDGAAATQPDQHLREHGELQHPQQQQQQQQQQQPPAKQQQQQQEQGDEQQEKLEAQHVEQPHEHEQQQKQPEQQQPPGGQQRRHEEGQQGVGEDDLEPQLKYERLGCDVKDVLQGTDATCLALSEKVLALGTAAGSIHILDYSGNEVKRFTHHSGPVRHLSFDGEAEYIASCCGENYVTVANLYTDEASKFTFKRPITVVTLDPRYGSRKTREMVTGDAPAAPAGPPQGCPRARPHQRCALHAPPASSRGGPCGLGWLGRSDHVLHQGEGAIQAVAWQGTTLAWANEVGVKVYSSSNHQLLGNLGRPKNGRFADCLACRLYLAPDEGAVYAAWADAVRVARIVAKQGDGATTTRHLQVPPLMP
ncbi:Vacuolar protein sorting-associated protein 41-like protein [Monoraphidium neglectum]|uniref:Vacuolar protein sorting-associated protein 41-like protein n=1 Tax=Monoraphidium neglectum TaxID=145388 RepID=A0A0D2JGR2_9CHLO|nr:Vacuolar protein sorting-associated protein 41-like protein [Monoraphidium neglectum]KIY98587.1 Vacuolar protein sorting-associated protein 41-like protein [Monoraphidium neglectum]|eukprot:XP_013897607.1 Vacuolar protein sorting-associated protein 41-like protein [Monoraphidium neglectum]